jgi:hypothetical protein
MPAKITPKRLSPTINPVARSTPIRCANSGWVARTVHVS